MLNPGDPAVLQNWLCIDPDGNGTEAQDADLGRNSNRRCGLANLRRAGVRRGGVTRSRWKVQSRFGICLGRDVCACVVATRACGPARQLHTFATGPDPIGCLASHEPYRIGRPRAIGCGIECGAGVLNFPLLAHRARFAVGIWPVIRRLNRLMLK
jgi:hypothetical protein